MTDDLQKLDGVGPAREERLAGAGYPTYEDLAQADPDALSDDIQRLPQDSALEIVVQAQNLADLEEATVEEQESTEKQDSDDEDESTSVDEEESDDESEAESETPDRVPVKISFDDRLEYDTFYQTVFEARNDMLRTNQYESTDPYNAVLDAMRGLGLDGTLHVELKPQELHDLHHHLNQKSGDYQGDNLTKQMDAIDRVERKVNAVREEHLFG